VRRYLRKAGKNKSFEIDAGKLAEEARFDGISVLRTNTSIPPLQAVIRYRDLLQVEALFRAAKASFDTRRIYHQSDAAIRGHVFCSFLALTLAKELTRLCEAKDIKPEWQPLLNDLDRLQQATIEKDGKLVTAHGPTQRARSATSSRLSVHRRIGFGRHHRQDCRHAAGLLGSSPRPR
jgi:hypothetical protein